MEQLELDLKLDEIETPEATNVHYSNAELLRRIANQLEKLHKAGSIADYRNGLKGLRLLKY